MNKVYSSSKKMIVCDFLYILVNKKKLLLKNKTKKKYIYIVGLKIIRSNSQHLRSMVWSCFIKKYTCIYHSQHKF